MKNTVFIIFCSFFLFSSSKPIKVLDESNNPIESVNIIDLHSQSIYKSNNQGYFYIDCKDRDLVQLNLSHIGYLDKIIEFNCDIDIKNIILKEDSLFNEETVVTGLRRETYIKNTPVLTHVITSEEIEKSAYSSVKEVLEISLPNVQNVISSHAGISNENVKIQGLDNKYLLFLVDGKRVSGEFAGNLDFKMLDLSDVERIEIVEGGMSSLYGSSAIGGVVNIISKKNKEPFSLTYSYMYDDPMVIVSSLSADLNYKNFFYGFNYVENNSDGYDLTPSEPDATYPINTLEEYSTFSLKQKFGYNNSKFNIAFNFKTYQNDIFLYQKHRMQILDQNNPNYPFYDYLTFRSWIPKFEDDNYGFDLIYNFNNSLLKVIYNFEEYYKSNYFFNYQEEDCDIVDCGNSNNLNAAEFVNGVVKNESFLIQYDIDNKHNLVTFGLEINDDSYSSYNIYHYGHLSSDGSFDEGDYNDDGLCGAGTPWDPDDCLIESIFNSQDDTKFFTKKAFFIGTQFDFNNDNKLGFSYRYVDSENYKNNSVYSIAYMVKEYQPFDIRLNYSKGFRTPAIKELYYDWYGHNPPIVGNPDLEPTTNDYISFSINRGSINNNFSIEAFYNDVNDMIGIDYTEDINGNQIAQYSNYNNILFYGINGHLDVKKGNSKFKFVYNYTYPESNNDDALELISKHSFRMNWVRNIIENKLDVICNVKYAGKKSLYLDSEEIILDDYFLFDLIAILNLNDFSEVKFGCKNLFDYKDSRRLLNEDNDFLTTYDPGRRFVLELKVNLN